MRSLLPAVRALPGGSTGSAGEHPAWLKGLPSQSAARRMPGGCPDNPPCAHSFQQFAPGTPSSVHLALKAHGVRMAACRLESDGLKRAARGRPRRPRPG